MEWTVDQEKVIHAPECNLLVSAAAGSGKTAVLVERIIRMITDPEHPINVDELLVVTFTRAAAAQMRDKIAAAIDKLLQEHPDNEHYRKQQNYIHRANILTIDSFCYQVVRENFYKLSLDPGIRVGDSGEIALLREQVLEDVLEECYRDCPDFVAFSDAFSADKKDANIEDYIRRIYTVCSSYPRPAEWIRQAKEAVEVQDREQFAALPYVKLLLQEIRGEAQWICDRIRDCMEKTEQTDGPLFLKKTFLEDLNLVREVTLAEDYDAMYRVAQMRFPNVARAKKSDEYDKELAEQLKDIRKNYKKKTEELLSCFSLPLEEILKQFAANASMLQVLLDAVQRFMDVFTETKLEHNILEFSDVEHYALQVLCEAYDEQGRPVPSEVAKEMAEGFREILIDEYQDSNYLQEAILTCVSGTTRGQNNMFMVGDVKQSIYRFRMARPDLFMDKYHTYSMEERADCRKLLLKNNFRSRANVLEGINYIFYQIMTDALGGIEYTQEEALVPGRSFPDGTDDSVEILLGESRSFDFLALEGEADAAKKEESLTENLEDIGKQELEATMIAGKIHRLMQEEQYGVTAEDGSIRPVQYKDIVILFRAPSAYQQVFVETLMLSGIPVQVQGDRGYLDSTEIRLLISLLRVADNPYNDVELAAVLRGFFGQMNSDALAVLVLLKRCLEKNAKRTKMTLYDVVKCVAGETSPETKEVMDRFWKEEMDSVAAVQRLQLEDNCSKVLHVLEELWKRLSYQTLADVVSYIYEQTGYYYYVQAMPEGKRRKHNLDLFLVETAAFDGGDGKGLFDFLLYVDKLLEKQVSMGEDAGMDEDADVVRIMSIHKSKGLEFPVVFVAGMGKQFNLTDTKDPLLIHSDYYLGAKFRDPVNRVGNDTFSRKAIAALMLTECIAEELRILYVAMTRAKEKLFLTGVVSDLTALVRDHLAVTGCTEQKLPYSILHKARSYMDFIVCAMMRNEVFHTAMEQQVRLRYGKKGEILSAKYELPYAIPAGNVSFRVEAYDFDKLVVLHVRSAAEKQLDKVEQLSNWRAGTDTERGKMLEAMDFTYAQEDLTIQKSKMSVTEIKRIYETGETEADLLELQPRTAKTFSAPVPEFVAGKRPMDAMEKGTWMHKLMELLPFGQLHGAEEVQETLELLWKEGRLPEETRAFLKADTVWTLLESPIGQRMAQADREGHLYREKQFVIGMPVDRIRNRPVREDAPEVVVQGIVDACFKEGDALVLLDYKTDHVKTGEEEKLRKRYRTQLQYYKETLERLTGLPVKESYLYSFALGKEIRMEQEDENAENSGC